MSSQNLARHWRASEDLDPERIGDRMIAKIELSNGKNGMHYILGVPICSFRTGVSRATLKMQSIGVPDGGPESYRDSLILLPFKTFVIKRTH